MATTTDLAEFAATIPIDDVPPKLRCGNCNKLLLNAFRLPCCDQQICEACHLSEPKSCPVCEHEPLIAADCKPHKTVRMTVKAFLKSEEKKREKLKPAPAAVTPTVDISQKENTAEAVAVGETNATDDHKILSPNGEKQDPSEQPEAPATANGNGATAEVGEKEDAIDKGHHLAGNDNDTTPSSPSSSVEFIIDHPDDHNEPAFGRSMRSQEPTDQPASRHGDGSERAEHGQEQSKAQLKENKMSEGQQGTGMVNDPNNGYNTANNGLGGANAFNNWQNLGPMDFTAMQGGVNPMWMQAMVGHMGLPAYNQMMQNPMAQQMMMGGFSGQGVGMQGMNNMMNMGGMGMNMPPNMAWNQNMAGGFDAGFYPDGGYNQQGFQGHPNQRSQYNQNFVQNRRGRGPRGGGYGRDQRPFGGRSQNHVPQAFAGSAQPFDQNHLMPSGLIQDDAANGTPSNDESIDILHHADPSTNEKQITNPDVDKSATDISAAHVQDQEQPNPTLQTQTLGVSRSNAASEPQHNSNVAHNDVRAAREVEAHHPQFPPVESSAVQDFDLQQGSPRHGRLGSQSFSRGSFESRGAFRGRGFSCTNGHVPNTIELTPKPIIPESKGQGVVGAPSGPKAMREGHAASIRGRGGIQGTGRAAVKPPTPIAPFVSAVAPLSRSPSLSKSHRSRRRRSLSPQARPEEGDNRDHRRERKHRNSCHQSREREGSVDDSTLGHRSRNDREKHRSSRKDRDRDHSREHRRRHRSKSPPKEDDGLEVHENGHSSRRDSKYREREGAKRGDKDRRRSRREPSHSRHDDAEERSRQRSSRAEKRPIEEKRATETKPQTPAPAKREFEIKGSSKRKQLESQPPKATPTGPRSHVIPKRSDIEVQKELVASEKPELDPYALEREAAMRTRLLKEEQRRQSVAGIPSGPSGKKRSSAAMEVGNAMSPLTNGANGVSEHKSKKRARHDERSGKARKSSYKYEDDEDSHARALRVENEREAARWD